MLLSRIPPMSASRPPQGHDGMPPDALLVASYNVHKCVGLDMRRDPVRTARVIGEIGADLIALQEADRRFGSRAGYLDLEALRETTGLTSVPLGREGPAHGWHGNVLLTRDLEIDDVRPLRLPGLEPRGALVVDLRREGVPVRVIAAHLGLLRTSRLQQARALVEALGHEDEARTTLLMGDLNEWRLRKRSSLEPLAARKALVHPVPSFPARFPIFALDRIMTSPCAEVLRVERHDSPLARIASDHLPIKAWVRLPGSVPEAEHVLRRAAAENG
jgi:endonuclease/exonuclease/phosphatase family metal-dependent hydrolase